MTFRPEPVTPARPLALALVLAGLFALSHGAMSLAALLSAGDALRVVDFSSFHYAADAAFNRGLSPYETETIAGYADRLGHRVYPFLYPPAALPLLYPLALLGYQAGAAAMLAMNALLAFGFFLLLHQMFLARLVGPAAFTAVVLVMLLFDAVRQTVGLGQVNLLPAVALLASWRLLREERRPWLAGALIGLAIIAKAYFAILLLPILVRREYRPLAGAATAVLAAILISLAVLPAELWADWAETAASRGGFGRLPFPEHPLVGTWNQSLNGVTTALLGAGAAAAGIGSALAALVMAISSWRLWRSRDLAAPAFYDSGFVLLSGALFLVAPLSWTHHLVFLAAPLLCLWARGDVLCAGRAATIVLGVLTALLAARWPLPALYGIAAPLASLPFAAVFAFWLFCLSGAALPWKSRAQPAYVHAG